MRIERKTEEKKMSMSKNIARLAVTAGLTAALSFGGVMAPVTMAFADGATTTPNSIKIKGNESNTFKAYQIFKATVTDTGSGKTAQDITWAVGEKAQKDIVKIIRDSAGYKTSENPLPNVDSATGKDPATAQNVADWLSANVQKKKQLPARTTIRGRELLLATCCTRLLKQ